MLTYFKKNASGSMMSFETALDPQSFRIGITWEDYLDGAFVLLSDEQVAFKEAHPNATIREIFTMTEPKVYVRSLADAKREKIQEIVQFDSSDAVNSFTINGVIPAWFTVTERLNYKQSVEAAKLLGQDKLSFFVGDQALEVATSLADGMLAQLQLYADACFIVTKQHKLAVEALETIEEVDAYNYMSGYPEKINFNLGE